MPDDVMPSRLGTGNFAPAQIFTDGQLRWEIDPETGALSAVNQVEPVTAPVRPGFFFRQSGGAWQFCCRFPSGATQILATEP